MGGLNCNLKDGQTEPLNLVERPISVRANNLLIKGVDHYSDQQLVFRELDSNSFLTKTCPITGQCTLLNFGSPWPPGGLRLICYPKNGEKLPDSLSIEQCTLNETNQPKADVLNYFDRYYKDVLKESVRGDFSYESSSLRSVNHSSHAIRQINFFKQQKLHTFRWTIDNLGSAASILVSYDEKLEIDLVRYLYDPINSRPYVEGRYKNENKRVVIYTDGLVLLGKLSGCYLAINCYQLPESDIMIVNGIIVGRWQLRSAVDDCLLLSCWVDPTGKLIGKCLASVSLKPTLFSFLPKLISIFDYCETDQQGNHFYVGFFDDNGQRNSKEEYLSYHQGRTALLQHYLTKDLATLLDYI